MTDLPSAPASSGDQLQTLRSILLADDDRFMRLMLQEVLTQTGYNTQVAANGAELLQKLSDGAKADLVILDWDMPELNGLDVVQKIKSLPHLAHIPIIMLSGVRVPEKIDAAMKAGLAAYVTKPVQRAAFCEVVQKILQPPQ